MLSVTEPLTKPSRACGASSLIRYFHQLKFCAKVETGYTRVVLSLASWQSITPALLSWVKRVSSPHESRSTVPLFLRSQHLQMGDVDGQCAY